MASSLVITINTERSQTQTRYDVKKGADKPKESLRALIQKLRAIEGKATRAVVKAQTGDAAPVAATGTWTLATIIATDVANIGGQAFLFSAGAPATENDVNVTVGSAKAFASATDISLNTGLVTETAHGYLTGDVGQFSTSSALPTGISASTDYHIIKLSADTYAIASSQANAVAGIRIYPTTTGTGNQTFTPNDDKCLAFRLAQAVNAHSTVGKIVTCAAAAAVVTATCNCAGVIGNFIQFTDQDATITSSGSGYLAGGTGGVMEAPQTYSFGL